MRRAAFLLVLGLFGCSTPEKVREREAAGGRYYGGVFNMNEGDDLGSLFPLSLTRSSAHHIASQVYEGLVGFDQHDLSIRPGLAGSWTIDESRTVYTFTLRSGVRFHDDTCFAGGVGRAFTATDVVESFTALCTPSASNVLFWLFQDKVRGANAHYAAVLAGRPGPGVSGIEEVDERTVRITLTTPYPNFLQILAHQGCWIFPKELIAHHGDEARWHPVGTGPFRLKRFVPGEVMVLERWPAYWGRDEHGNQLPFLDAIRCTFVKEKEQELQQFEKGNLSMIYELPLDRTEELLSSTGYQVQAVPGLTVQFYGLDHHHPPFDDVRIRKAISLAIDRQAIVDSVLNGLAVPATHGVVAPGFADYPYDSVPTLMYDPAKASALLAAAGHPGGSGMPGIYLQVNSDGFGYIRVAEAVQEMLSRNLGLRVITSVLPAEQHYKRVEMGQARIWREGWIVDHPDPENFLALFYGLSVPTDTAQPSYLNSTRYRNATYDSLFARALRTPGISERMHLLAEAEHRLMEDMVVAPLYHERSVRLLQPWVRDLPINGMEVRDLRTTWFDPSARSDK
ncbi:MAG TPA: ABC transporter substrate-binding protein [Flavobacteriales bacterium]|nr:ABC transporter substrate-binding protein [Flavobacteriales bacterium]HNU55052.1 ABC transporter substrate-binding protein [Flavobacteriales bacterium]